MKTCKACKKKKPLSAFKRYYNGSVGLRPVCKKCERASLAHYSRQRRIKAFKQFNEECADCGVKSNKDNYVIFDFHHLDPKKKEMSFQSGRYVSNKRYFEELKKCIMLCSNCHRIRHFNERRMRNPERYA